MPAIDSLQVILELNDGNFTTRVVRAGEQLASLSTAANVTVKSVNNLTSSLTSGSAGLVGWTIALGEARHAVHTLHAIFGSWIEKIISVNSHIEQTVAMMAGFSTAATQADRLAEGMRNVQSAMQLAANTPFRLDSIHDVFVKLQVGGLNPLGGSIKSLSDAVAAFGGNDEKFKHAAYAIQDMAGKGVISMEELRRQLGQHIPNAMPLMARAMNVTVQELILAVTKGTLESKNAIQQMFAEFDRTFSGQAAERMNTLSGALAQLTTSFMHLGQVAGGTQIDQPDGTSSYKTLIEGVKMFNESINSPEMQGAAVRVNMMLKSVMDAANGLIPLLPVLANNISLIGKAFEVLAAIIAAKMIGGLLGILGGLFVSLMAGAGYLVGGIMNLARAIPAMVAAIPAAATAVAAFGSAVALNLGIVGAAVTGATGGLAALAAGFAVVAVPTAILAGLGMIIYNLSQVKGASAEAGEALKRLAQGDYTKKTQVEAKDELQNLRDKSAILQKQYDLLNKMTETRNYGQVHRLQNIGAFGDGEELNIADAANAINRSRPNTKGNNDQIAASFTELRDKVAAALAELNTLITSRSSALEDAPMQLAKRNADVMFQRFQSNFASALQTIDREFDQKQKQIEERRKQIASLPVAQRSDQVKIANEESLESAKKRYNDEYALYASFLKKEEDLLAQSLAGKNNDQIQSQQIFVDLIKKAIELRQEQTNRDLAAKGLGLVAIGSDDKSYTKQIEKAGEATQNLKSRIAQLNEQLSGTAGYAAKARTELEAGGKYQLVGPDSEEGKKYIEAADNVDKLTAALKQFNKEKAAQNKLDLGLEKAESELEGLILKMTNPDLPEAQRSFIILQRQMNQALNDLVSNIPMDALDDYALKLGVIGKAQAAIAKGATVQVMKDVDRISERAENQLISSLTPVARAAAQLKKDKAEIATAREALKNDLVLTPAQRETKLTQLNTAETQLTASANNRIGAAGARASAPADNAVTQLTGRLAELKAQASDTGSEYARWLAMLDSPASRGKYAGQRDEILALAKAIDGMDEKVKLANEAKRALDAIRHDADHASDEVAVTKRLLTAGKLLDVEREILKFQVKQEDHLTRVAAGPGGVAQAESERPKTETAIADFGYAALLKKTEANRTLTETIKAGFADTLAARRVAGQQEVSFEENHLSRLIAKYAESNEERKAQELDLSNYVAARREEVNRKTEDGFERLAREWSDASAMMADFGANVTSRFVDDLVTKLTTGKASWTDFADWAIKELLRVQLRAAAAPAMSALGSLAGVVGSAIGGALGLGGTSFATEPVTAQSFQPETGRLIGRIHGGGIAGRESSFHSNTPMSLFNNAPRFHGGTGPIRGNEVAAVLEKGEGVFTAGQMAAIGKLNYNYAFVQDTLAQLLTSVEQLAQGSTRPSIPTNDNYGFMKSAFSQLMESMNRPAAPPVTKSSIDNYDGKGSSKTAMPVTINVQNNSSQPISAVASLPKFDGEQMIIDVVIRNINQPGPLRNAMRDAR